MHDSHWLTSSILMLTVAGLPVIGGACGFGDGAAPHQSRNDNFPGPPLPYTLGAALEQAAAIPTAIVFAQFSDSVDGILDTMGRILPVLSIFGGL